MIVDQLTADERKVVAELIREARELMNNSGKHWVKGEFTRIVDGGEIGYCSMGALNQVFYSKEETDDQVGGWARRDAILALAEDEAIAAVHYSGNSRNQHSIAEWQVITYNDGEDRTWPEVEAAFKRTEERLLAAS